MVEYSKTNAFQTCQNSEEANRCRDTWIADIFCAAILSDEFFANDLSLSALQRYQYYRLYLLGGTVVIVGALFLLRYVTVVIYRSALLKTLRFGWIMPEDLPDNLRT